MAPGESRGVPLDSDTSPDLDRIFPFPLDAFQRDAIASIDAGRNVVVCAPTGAGKTAVAEYAVQLALSQGLRCFYTTPLKALSNQKFFDFRASLGAHRVGLLTGDISIHRDAPVVVMTTEVFRNMLYGTTLGEVSRNMERVRFVVLDECHFMNDVERGTVWEESIIYAPPGVQLVALSATIANAEELRQWMTTVHGDTDLSLSGYRPVPLRFYYFVKGNVYRLLDPDGKLNPQLVGISGARPAPGAPRGGRKLQGDRSRREPSLERPEMDVVCRTLDRRKMLPAIFFVFSRKGCEEALRRCEESVTLTAEEQDELRRAIDEAIEANPALASHPHLPFLYLGVAAHHAGLLPSWKSLVERLFVRGLVKAVFATETLAAGINMPARTTVISAISKRSDEGHRALTASEFLQMSGRAGRRGMDTVGNVVILNHPREPVEDASRLARAKSDPLVSQFTPSYGMVLNLLQRHTRDECHLLLEKSFGQFLANRSSSGLHGKLQALDEQIQRLSGPLCPDEIGDLPRYHKLYDQIRSLRKQTRAMQRGVDAGAQPPDRPGRTRRRQAAMSERVRTLGLEATIGGQRERAAALLEEVKAMPCHGCPVQDPCGRQGDDLRHVQNRRADLVRHMRRAGTPYQQQFEDLSAVLSDAGYVQNDVPTAAGRMAAALRATNVLFIAEVIRSGLLDALHPEDAAAVLTAIITEETRRTEPQAEPSDSADDALRRVVDLARHVDRLQHRFHVDVPLIVNPIYSGLTQIWARGTSWEDMRSITPFDEGDVVRSLRRTVDLARQISRAPEITQATATVCRQVEEQLSRDEVREEFLAAQLPPEVLADMEEQEPVEMIEVIEELLEEDDVLD